MLVPLGLTVQALAADAGIYKKILEYGVFRTTTLIMSSKKSEKL